VVWRHWRAQPLLPGEHVEPAGTSPVKRNTTSAGDSGDLRPSPAGVASLGEFACASYHASCAALRCTDTRSLLRGGPRRGRGGSGTTTHGASGKGRCEVQHGAEHAQESSDDDIPVQGGSGIRPLNRRWIRAGVGWRGSIRQGWGSWPSKSAFGKAFRKPRSLRSSSVTSSRASHRSELTSIFGPCP
jgi:hypothetical protein